MPEGTPGEVTPAAPQPTVATPPANPAPSVPDGMELVPRDELANLRRNADQYRGNAPLINRLVQSGIKSGEELDSALGPVRQAREMGLDLNGVLTSLRRPETPATQEEEKPLTRTELASFMQDMKTREHHESVAAREGELIQSLVTQLVGEKGSEVERRAARGLVYDFMSDPSVCRAYESGPFKGQVMPLSEREFASIQKSATDAWQAIRGQRLQEVAANAGTARAAPPAPGGAGAATSTDASKPMPGTPEHRALVMQRLEQLEARRSGAPLSQA